jgi:hypothetical protein
VHQDLLGFNTTTCLQNGTVDDLCELEFIEMYQTHGFVQYLPEFTCEIIFPTYDIIPTNEDLCSDLTAIKYRQGFNSSMQLMVHKFLENILKKTKPFSWVR